MTSLFKFTRPFILAVAPLLALVTVACSEEKPAEVTESAKRYEVPTGDDVQVLVKFIKDLKDFNPTTQEEADEHNAKILGALGQASARLLELEKDTTSEAYRMGKLTSLQVRVIEIPKLSADEQKAIFQEALDFVANQKKPALGELGLAAQTAQALDDAGSPLAAEAYGKIGALLEKQENPEIVAYGKTMLGCQRRLTLVGNPIELKGTTVDGKPFDVADLKGKVVLVDFWATWCGPCVAEYPNIKRNYEKYHDSGFEVIGLSLDQNRMALERYLKEKEVPWPTLHENNDQGQHPAAQYYGVRTIPFMVLVDRDGKVISTEARGEQLDQLLGAQFGSDKPSSEKSEEKKSDNEK